MAYTGKANTHLRRDGGGNYDAIDAGSFQFNGTALSLELPVRLSQIRPGSQLMIMPGTAAPTSMERVFINEAPNSDGNIDVDDDGEITIGRQVEVGGTQTTDLQVWYRLIGASRDV